MEAQPSSLSAKKQSRSAESISVILATEEGHIVQKIGEALYLKQDTTSLFDTDPPELGLSWREAFEKEGPTTAHLDPENQYQFLLDRTKDGILLVAFTACKCRDTKGKLERSEEQLKLALDAARIGIWEWDVDSGLLSCTDNVEQILHMPAGTFDGRCATYIQLVHPDDRKMLETSLDEALKEEASKRKTPYTIEHRIIAGDGSIRWLAGCGSVIRNGGTRMIGMVWDITERKETAERIAENESRLRLIVEQTGQVIYDYDFLNDSIHWAGATSEITGYSASELQSMNIDQWADHIHPGDRDKAIQDLQAARANRSRYSVIYRFRRKDGTCIHVRDNGSFLLDEDGQPVRMLGSMADITEQCIAEDIVRHRAHHDGLTGLPNRSLALDRLVLALAHARRMKENLAVLFLDLDRFKPINDTLGHSIGDGLLIEVSHRLVAALRADDTVSRSGGDEFIILLPGMQNAAQAGTVAEKIVQELNAPFSVAGYELRISSSIGIAIFPEDGSAPEELIHNADTALYRSKEAGRNQYAFYSETHGTSNGERSLLLQDLKTALQKNQLRLVFQPLFSMGGHQGNDHRIVSYEALLRWQHPRLGTLLPGRFLSLAEESGLMLCIGDWVIDEGLRHLKGWIEDGHSSVLRINVSPQQFFQPRFVDRLTGRMSSFNLPAAHVCLEIQEAVALQRGGPAEQILRELNAAGFSVSIDNFGTGYGSLQSLQDYPISEVKIDRSLTGSLKNRKSQSLTQGLLQLAKSLGLNTAAGGVESEQQRKLLFDFGCETAQGWFFSPPRSAPS